MTRWLGFVLGGLAVLLVPALAAACPSCAQNDSNTSFYWLLGGMVLAPFPVVAAAIYFIRKVGQAGDAAPGVSDEESLP